MLAMLLMLRFICILQTSNSLRSAPYPEGAFLTGAMPYQVPLAQAINAADRIVQLALAVPSSSLPASTPSQPHHTLYRTKYHHEQSDNLRATTVKLLRAVLLLLPAMTNSSS